MLRAFLLANTGRSPTGPGPCWTAAVMEVCTVSIMAESQISPVEVEPEIAIKCRVEARKRFSTETEKENRRRTSASLKANATTAAGY